MKYGLAANRDILVRKSPWRDILENEKQLTTRSSVAVLIFHYGVAAAESQSSHWVPGRVGKVPLPGAADGKGVISVGTSQVVCTNIDADTDLANKYFKLNWQPSLDRRLRDPYYNYMLGLSHFKGNVDRLQSNNVCSWYIAYNGGDARAK